MLIETHRQGWTDSGSVCVCRTHFNNLIEQYWSFFDKFCMVTNTMNLKITRKKLVNNNYNFYFTYLEFQKIFH